MFAEGEFLVRIKKVVQFTPSFFDDSSVIGGGERYPTELARNMARVVPTTLVSFGSRRRSETVEGLRYEIFPVRHFLKGNKVNPLSFRYLQSLFFADVMHVHQINTFTSDLAALVGGCLRRRVFVTDHGGGASVVLNKRLPVFRAYRRTVSFTPFGCRNLPKALQENVAFIKGGIDTERFCPDSLGAAKENTVLFVGRIAGHKGINYLIEAFKRLSRPGVKLKIVGRVHDAGFYKELCRLAEGANVEFIHDASDARLLAEYRAARVTVLPSVHRDMFDRYTAVPELMGFTLLESQACGTPVICTDAGAMPEFVEHERTGMVVEQNSPEALCKALERMFDLSSEEYGTFARNARALAERMNWDTVVQEHLKLYRA